METLNKKREGRKIHCLEINKRNIGREVEEWSKEREKKNTANG